MGSEMCIRDRATTPRSRRRHHHTPGLWHFHAPHGPPEANLDARAAPRNRGFSGATRSGAPRSPPRSPAAKCSKKEEEASRTAAKPAPEAQQIRHTTPSTGNPCSLCSGLQRRGGALRGPARVVTPMVQPHTELVPAPWRTQENIGNKKKRTRVVTTWETNQALRKYQALR